MKHYKALDQIQRDNYKRLDPNPYNFANYRKVGKVVNKCTHVHTPTKQNKEFVKEEKKPRRITPNTYVIQVYVGNKKHSLYYGIVEFMTFSNISYALTNKKIKRAYETKQREYIQINKVNYSIRVTKYDAKQSK